VRISRIRVEGFRCLSGLDWRPAPGLNFVLGPNEAGKSTLADFICAMVFGLSGGAEGERSAPWKGGPFCGRLELDCGKFLVTMERDFATGRLFYQETNSETGQSGEPLSIEVRRGSTGPAFKRYRELFSRHLGFFDETLFRRSVFVPQGEMELAGRDLVEAASALRALASGGGSAYDRALEMLKERYHNLANDGDNRRKPGLLDQLRSEKSDLAAALREIAAQAGRTAGLRAQVEDRNGRLAALRAEVAEAARLTALARERGELIRRRTALAAADDAQRRRLDDAEGALRSAADLDQRLAAYDDLAEAGGDFPQVVSRARGAREKSDRLDADREERRRELDRQNTPAWPLVLTVVLLVAGALGAAGGFAGPGLALWLPGAAVSAAGLGMLGWTLVQRSRLAATRERIAADLARAEAELAHSRSEVEATSAELMRQAGGRADFAAGAMDQLLKRYGERLDLAARRTALGAHLLDEESIAGLREACATGVRELAVLDQRLEQLAAGLGKLGAAGEADERMLAALPAKVVHLEEGAAKLAAELRGFELDLAAASASEVSPESMEERLAELDAMIAKLEARCRALRLAREELSASIHEFQESHLERLGALASDCLEGFTAGRYPRVRLAGESLLPAVSGAGREELGPEVLSQGTRSALYLAVRLALGELLAGGRALPLILDDPLVDLDDARRAAVLALLRRLGDRTQVVLLSCDRRLAEAGVPVLELGG
jgi:DNA repair exonuclease SbcCD ATPase subunit